MKKLKVFAAVVLLITGWIALTYADDTRNDRALEPAQASQRGQP